MKYVRVEAAVIFTHPGARLIVKGNNSSVKGLRIEDLGNSSKRVSRSLRSSIESMLSGMGSKQEVI